MQVSIQVGVYRAGPTLLLHVPQATSDWKIHINKYPPPLGLLKETSFSLN